MDIVTGLAAFFHLCFCFDLKYPKVKIVEVLEILVNLRFIRKVRRLPIWCRGECANTVKIQVVFGCLAVHIFIVIFSRHKNLEKKGFG